MTSERAASPARPHRTQRGVRVLRAETWSVQTKWAAAAALLTLIAVLLHANLTTPDQTVEHPIAHRYGPRDPRFLRTMTHLLGSPVVTENRVTALLNGDQAFATGGGRTAEAVPSSVSLYGPSAGEPYG